MASTAATTNIAEQENRPRLTRRVLFVLCAINLIDCINVTILSPYVDAMVSTILHKPRGDPSVAMWVSVLVGSYSICEVMFSGFWGMLSDRIGRRPVLLIGLAGSAVAPIILGLSKSIPCALFARLLDGFFCGNAGVTRTYLGEVVDETNEARAFGYLSLMFSIGLFIGPLLGGLISEPTTLFPSLDGTIFDSYPYLLPNITYAVFAVVALLVGACALEETRQVNRQDCANQQRDVLLSSEARGNTVPRGVRWPKRLIYMMVSISLLFGYTTARLNAFVLVTALPRSLDGLAFGPRNVGYIQVCAAFWILFTQMCLYERGINRFGEYRCVIGGLGFTVLLLLPFPAYCAFADPSKFGLWRFVPIGLWQCVSQIGFSFSFPTAFLLMNRDCTSDNRGAVNGFSQSLAALSRGTFPFVAGALVQWGVSAEPSGFVGGRYLAFYVICLVGLFNIWLLAKKQRPSPDNLSELEHPDLPKEFSIQQMPQADEVEAGA